MYYIYVYMCRQVDLPPLFGNDHFCLVSVEFEPQRAVTEVDLGFSRIDGGVRVSLSVLLWVRVAQPVAGDRVRCHVGTGEWRECGHRLSRIREHSRREGEISPRLVWFRQITLVRTFTAIPCRGDVVQSVWGLSHLCGESFQRWLVLQGVIGGGDAVVPGDVRKNVVRTRRLAGQWRRGKSLQVHNSQRVNGGLRLWATQAVRACSLWTYFGKWCCSAFDNSRMGWCLHLACGVKAVSGFLIGYSV